MLVHVCAERGQRMISDDFIVHSLSYCLETKFLIELGASHFGEAGWSVSSWHLAFSFSLCWYYRHS